MTEHEKVARIVVLAKKMHIKLGSDRYCSSCRFKGSVVCDACVNMTFWKGEDDARYIDTDSIQSTNYDDPDYLDATQNEQGER